MFSLYFQALCRDGFRCAVSRVLDLDYEPKLPGVQSDGSGGITQCAHIIPEALNSGLDNPTKVRGVFFRSYTF
jgi:hypothetical protein